MAGTALTSFRAVLLANWAYGGHRHPHKGLRADFAIKGSALATRGIDHSVIYVPAPPRGSGQHHGDAELNERPNLTRAGMLDQVDKRGRLLGRSLRGSSWHSGCCEVLGWQRGEGSARHCWPDWGWGGGHDTHTTAACVPARALRTPPSSVINQLSEKWLITAYAFLL